MKKNKTKIFFLILGLLFFQTVIYVWVGNEKSYLHMDEAYSYGLTNYNKTEIQENEDFYNTWHQNDYYEDYLSVSEVEESNFTPVYVNQKNDVHPPLYYFLLRIVMNFSIGHFSKWSGLILNIIIGSLITIFTYLILKILLKKEKHFEVKSALLAFISSLTLSSLTNIIYIRMYALSTLFILITLFLHLKLLTHKNEKKWMVGIALTALLGSLTHYYYLFFLFMIYVIFLIKYLREKDYKSLTWYTAFLSLAAILSLLIFPYSISHMFFGYRGTGFIHNLFNLPMAIKNIGVYLFKLQAYTFHWLLIFIILIILGIVIFKKRTKPILTKEEKENLKLMIIPTIFYFLLVAVASPFIELRYILPICSLVFIVVIFLFYKYLKSIFKEQKTILILGIFFFIMFLIPFIFHLEPETMYTNRRDIIEKIEPIKEVPTLYVYNSKQDRFLDDILLFRKVENSYIGKDLDLSKDNIETVFKDQDLSRGLVLIINYGQDNEAIIKRISETLKLENHEYLSRLNIADVYYLH